MTRFGGIAGVLAALSLCAGNAIAAVDAVPYWSSARWNVQIVASRQKCMAMADYTARNGQYFNLAFEAFINGSAELLVSSPPWANLFKEGRKYWVNVSFDNSKPQRLLAVAYSENGLAFSELTFDAILALAKSNTLILQYQGNRIAGLNLPGSYEAVDKTIGCANALKTYIQNDGTGPADVDDGTGPADQVPGTTLAPLQQQTPAPPPKPTAPPAPTTPAPSAAPTPINL